MTFKSQDRKLHKNRLYIILLCGTLLLAAVCFGVSSIRAYFIDSDTASNTITVGNNDIDVITVGSGLGVENLGTVDCYVRVFAELEEPGEALSVLGEGWSSKQTDGYYYYEPMLTPIGTAGNVTSALAADAEGLLFYAESIQAHGFEDVYDAFDKSHAN